MIDPRIAKIEGLAMALLTVGGLSDEQRAVVEQIVETSRAPDPLPPASIPTIWPATEPGKWWESAPRADGTGAPPEPWGPTTITHTRVPVSDDQPDGWHRMVMR